MSDQASLVEFSRAERWHHENVHLDRSGTLLINVQLHCGAQQPATVTLSATLPAGRIADPRRQWDVPLCMRIGLVDGKGAVCGQNEPTIERSTASTVVRTG
jgi:hypothetical protein